MAYKIKSTKQHFVKEPYGLPRELQPTGKFYTDEDMKELLRKAKKERRIY